MEPLGFFLAGALVGAACMWTSGYRARMAMLHERRRMEKRENRLIEERDAYHAESEKWKVQVMDMHIDQENSAGYIDGFNACRREMENRQGEGFPCEFFTQSLRDGAHVFWTVTKS